MTAIEQINSSETILRRITSHPNNTTIREIYGLTATSKALRPRKKTEDFPSYSLARITSAVRLLELEANKGTDIQGWGVLTLTVSAVRKHGLDVVASPTEEDPGHCHIEPTQRQSFTKQIWSRLAKETKIIYPA